MSARVVKEVMSSRRRVTNVTSRAPLEAYLFAGAGDDRAARLLRNDQNFMTNEAISHHLGDARLIDRKLFSNGRDQNGFLRVMGPYAVFWPCSDRSDDSWRSEFAHVYEV
ncbi:hypothetical protein [Methylocella tundrae]|jgi:hypothetical protein|uniref:hypothetical protein n=1 Tax=Methylocella tundrae TaxID=227605 RepID=UPI00157B755C|nr:hypothetical protein [Methylocella tundrae]